MKKQPKYVVCGRCRRERHSFSALRCKHPAVRRTYGECHICMYCCMTCKHHVKGEWGGIRCGYEGGKENENQNKGENGNMLG